MKTCPGCGRPLPEDAHFCPGCGTELIIRVTPSMPRLWLRPFLRIGIPVLSLIILALAAVWVHIPETIDRHAPELIYTADGTALHLLLRTSASDAWHWQTPQESYDRMVTKDTQAAIPLQLYVYDEATGKNAADLLLPLVESSSVTIHASGASDTDSMTAATAVSNEMFPEAAMVSDVVYTADAGSGELLWTLRLKNGDRLVLHESYHISVRPEVMYSWEESPLDTMEEVQALADRILDEVPSEAVVTIVLAPHRYEGDLVLTDRAVSLSGTDDGTVMAGTVYLESSDPQIAGITGITFSGKAAGIRASAPLFVEDCRFEDTDTGILAQDGAWPMPYRCSFVRCRIGLRIDSSYADVRNSLLSENRFSENETAVLLERMPGDVPLLLGSCVFEGNDTDLDNRTENRVEMP